MLVFTDKLPRQTANAYYAVLALLSTSSQKWDIKRQSITVLCALTQVGKIRWEFILWMQMICHSGISGILSQCLFFRTQPTASSSSSQVQVYLWKLKYMQLWEQPTLMAGTIKDVIYFLFCCLFSSWVFKLFRFRSNCL